MIRRLRLITGLILFSYISLHLIPLILGNHSLAIMEFVRPSLHGFWESWPGLILLYGAMAIHMALGFYAIYTRHRWKGIGLGEIVQLASGIAVPALLCLHVVSTRIAAMQYGIQPSYPWIMAIYLKYDTMSGWRQAAALIVAWFHGCLGLYYWLRLKPFWPGIRFGLFGLAILWPALALTGFYKAGTEAAALTDNPAWVRVVLREVGSLSQSDQMVLYQIQDALLLALAGMLTVSLAARFVRRQVQKRAGFVILNYDDGRDHRFTQGLSILEASRDCSYPHASVCGGRGRCSTCRVRIRQGQDLLPPPSEEELKVLKRVRAGPDVRLACQAIPLSGEIHITPLLPHTATASHRYARSDMAQGKEITIAVMFCDLRGFTRVSEDRLPYDTVFLLNRYFDAMGKAIEESGGHLDKFIGDGIMALFGIETTPEDGCRQALIAAKRMSERLIVLNKSLEQDLDEPLRIGIGIHVGSVIVGEMGYGRATQLTAIGDAVNTASRLEALTKDYGAQLVASKTMLQTADISLGALPYEEHEAEIRGRVQPIRLIAIRDASLLAL
ncbi:adenylate/guanylate cyclase domain-containing protein [Hwanghaeella sp. LZ110]|uniref:adenylate/guanylate cyclase domain-containing protein n=1 Tax=Hwanghaeella sp. LZ110 TaxID=3402810 RepID=UPI003B67EBEA